jgi:hypothetical protein
MAPPLVRPALTSREAALVRLTILPLTAPLTLRSPALVATLASVTASKVELRSMLAAERRTEPPLTGELTVSGPWALRLRAPGLVSPVTPLTLVTVSGVVEV